MSDEKIGRDGCIALMAMTLSQMAAALQGMSHGNDFMVHHWKQTELLMREIEKELSAGDVQP